MKTPILLAYAFRPLFLAAAVFGAMSIVAWSGLMLTGWQLPLSLSPALWHSHEMIFGLTPAVIAGFVLTAGTNWTSAPPLKGLRLLGLILLWISGRLCFYFSGLLVAQGIPYWFVALIEFSFLPVFTLYFLYILLKYNNTRNLKIIALLAMLITGNFLMHFGVTSNEYNLINTGKNLGINSVILLIILIAGRITPAFSKNWLKRQNMDYASIRSFPLLDNLAMGSVVLIAVIDVFLPNHFVLGIILIISVFLNLCRAYFWAVWLILREPLLWILHLGYIWIIIGFGLRAATIFGDSLSESLWQHTLGVGAIGTLLLGVMTRVAVGHTGRKIELVPFGIWIYICVTLATVIRLLVSAHIVEFQLGILLTSIFWVIAWLLFVVLYWSILSSPRPDGKPG